MLYLLWGARSHSVKRFRIYLESRLRKNLDYLASFHMPVSMIADL
jgi:hypothetical protein